MLGKRINQILEGYGKKITERLRRQIREKDAVASGDLFRSVRYDNDDKSLNIYYNSELNAHSFGLRSNLHSPSRASIVRWMKAKGLQPRGKEPTEKNYQRAAFLIGRSIYRNGTIKRFGYQGSNILDTAWSESQKKALSRDVAKAYQEKTVKDLETTFKKNGFTIK